jgi:hypothetical protein
MQLRPPQRTLRTGVVVAFGKRYRLVRNHYVHCTRD